MKTDISKNCIFVPEKSKTKESGENEYYCIIGSEDFLDNQQNPRSSNEDAKTLAKKIITETNKHMLYIKLDENKKFINPLSIYATSEKPQYIENMKKFKSQSYKLVGPKAFNYYINFLKTKNTAWLTNAERESE